MMEYHHIFLVETKTPKRRFESEKNNLFQLGKARIIFETEYFFNFLVTEISTSTYFREKN